MADTEPDDGDASGTDTEPAPETEELTTAELREEVEAAYDFENFGPHDMAEMSGDEWEAAFDPDTWITGDELLDRVTNDLARQVADREVFARIERHPNAVLAYADNGYAVVRADGTVQGAGTVLRDVKPTVALCSMDSYEVPEPPEDPVLPTPKDVPESSGSLGNTVMQVIAGVQVLAGVVLLVAWLGITIGVFTPPSGASVRTFNATLLFVVGAGFIGIGLFLFLTVANARLSDRFRAEEYRDRLRAIGIEDGERPDYLAEIEDLDLPPHAGHEVTISGLEVPAVDEADADE
jgi:hypothetical protein